MNSCFQKGYRAQERHRSMPGSILNINRLGHPDTQPRARLSQSQKQHPARRGGRRSGDAPSECFRAGDNVRSRRAHSRRCAHSPRAARASRASARDGHDDRRAPTSRAFRCPSKCVSGSPVWAEAHCSLQSLFMFMFIVAQAWALMDGYGLRCRGRATHVPTRRASRIPAPTRSCICACTLPPTGERAPSALASAGAGQQPAVIARAGRDYV